jgi:pseudoazurin
MSYRVAPLAIALALTAGAAGAEEHVVRMLNEGSGGERMVFEPAVVHAEPGDTVRFVPEDRGHNAQTVRGAIPEDAETMRGGFNQEVTYTVEESGLHLVNCTPHYGLGMIALIVSDDDFSNEEAVRDAVRPRQAQERLDTYLERAKIPAAG